MLESSILQPQGILVIRPSAPLSKQDFSGLSAEVNAYLTDHDTLHGVLIHAKGFPGWENFGGFAAHMHFVREHHKQIQRIAIVTDSALAGMAEMLGKHFTSAQVRHFAFAEHAQAMQWLTGA